MAWLPRSRVIVPYDFSDDSLAALRLGREFVTSPSTLHVVHVLPELLATEPGVIWTSIDDASRIEHAREAMKKKPG